MTKTIKSIPPEKNRLNRKQACQLWLNPSVLNATQIRETINDFDVAIEFTLDPETYEDRLVGFISILIDDILEMNISEEEKDKSILDLVLKPSKIKIFSSLAKRAMRQIDIDTDNYKREALNRGYCSELVKRA